MKILKSHGLSNALLFVGSFFLIIPIFNSCSKDTSEGDLDDVAASICLSSNEYYFNEVDGLVLVEFENAEFSEDWTKRSDGDNFSGEGYMVWEGTQYLHEPGNGKAIYIIKITNTGTYQFVWNSAVKTGNNGTEHNDTWLRFADASDFYAKNGDSVVYPLGSGKTPNPEGASKDGWFKVYRSGDDLDFKWNSLTYDNNGHEIFVVFEQPGNYLMEISARSSGHGVDKFVLFKDSITFEEATTNAQTSTITCD